MEKPITAKIYRYEAEGEHTLVHEAPYSGEGSFPHPPLPPGVYACMFEDANGYVVCFGELQREEEHV